MSQQGEHRVGQQAKIGRGNSADAAGLHQEELLHRLDELTSLQAAVQRFAQAHSGTSAIHSPNFSVDRLVKFLNAATLDCYSHRTYSTWLEDEIVRQEEEIEAERGARNSVAEELEEALRREEFWRDELRAVSAVRTELEEMLMRVQASRAVRMRDAFLKPRRERKSD